MLARIRTIKPEFWVDDVMVELPLETRLLFVGLWNFVDDEGFIEDKPKRIKMQIFPADDVLIEDSLSALVDSGRLHAFDSDQGPILQVANWSRHQKINRPTPTRFTGITPKNGRDSVSTHGYVSEHSRGKGKERKGRERKGKEITPLPPSGELVRLPTPFDQVWESWPKKTEKDRSQSEYAKHVRDVPDLASLIATFGDAYARTTEKHYIPSLAAWLHRKRWTDELPQPRDGGSRVQQGLSVADELRRMEAGHAGQ